VEREKLDLDREQALSILDEYNEDFEVIKDEIYDDGARWTNTYELIVKRILDNKYFRSYYTRGATEYQEQGPWEYENPKFIEVFPVEKTIIVYE